MTSIDLNADMGESFGAYSIGDDKGLLEIVSSANIACGFHGGDPVVMNKTILMAKAADVRIGAHPGFQDMIGFGRRIIRGDSPEDLRLSILYQMGAFHAMARANGAQMAYVKLHGALANLAMVEVPFAEAFISAVKLWEEPLPVMGMPRSRVEAVAEREGVVMIREAYADRAYTSDGMLMPRNRPGAVIHDGDVAAERVLRMLDDRRIMAEDGTRIDAEIDSVCVHGDNPEALRIAEKIRTKLERAGVVIRATPELVGSLGEKE